MKSNTTTEGTLANKAWAILPTINNSMVGARAQAALTNAMPAMPTTNRRFGPNRSASSPCTNTAAA